MNTPILESRFSRMGSRVRVVSLPEAPRLAGFNLNTDQEPGGEFRPADNAAVIRQGEWFFMPVEGLVVDAKRVHHDEPLRRTGGSPHLVEMLYRTGGEAVYHHAKTNRVLTVPQYRRLLQQRPREVREWRIMQRGMAAYGRGAVRHPDHGTIMLHDWHRILMNTESEAQAVGQVALPD